MRVRVRVRERERKREREREREREIENWKMKYVQDYHQVSKFSVFTCPLSVW